LVRAANEALQDEPLTSLVFFHKLRRNHYPPYYSIPGIHAPANVNEYANNDEPIKILEPPIQEGNIAVGTDDSDSDLIPSEMRGSSPETVDSQDWAQELEDDNEDDEEDDTECVSRVLIGCRDLP